MPSRAKAAAAHGRWRTSMALIQLMRRSANEDATRTSSSRISTGTSGAACEAALSACSQGRHTQVTRLPIDLLGAAQHAACEGRAQVPKMRKSGSSMVGATMHSKQCASACQVVVGVDVPPAPHPAKPVRRRRASTSCINCKGTLLTAPLACTSAKARGTSSGCARGRGRCSQSPAAKQRRLPAAARPPQSGPMLVGRHARRR